MDFVIESVHFQPYHPQWENFRQSPTEPIGRDLYKRGQRLQILAKASAPHKTYLLRASISLSYNRGVTNPFVTITANVPYAYWVHEGTRRHQIYPTRRRVLRFVVGGRVIYAQHVNHPGGRPDPFLAKHLRTVVR